MSKIYEALQRVGSERAEYQARAQRMRAVVPSGSRDWWNGALVGCIVGLGIALVAIPAMPTHRAPLQPPEAIALVSAVTHTVLSPPEPRTAEAVVDEIPLTAPASEPEPVATAPAPEPVATAPEPEPVAAAPEPEPVAAAPEPVATIPAPGPLGIQVGTFRNRENAARLAARLKAERYQVTIEPSRADETLWVVRVGDYSDRDPAELAKAGLARQGVPGIIVSKELKRDPEGGGRQARASGER